MLWTAAAAAITSAALVLALLPVLQRHALARPNARSSHRVATPQGGGIAVVGATVVAAAAAAAIGVPSAPDLTSLWMLVTAAAFIAAVGAVDDIRTIEVLPRLLLQTLAVGLAIASVPSELRIVPMLPWWI